LWMASWCEWLSLLRMAAPLGFLGLKIIRVQGGPNRRQKWAGPAGMGRPAQAHFCPVRSPLRSRGSSGNYELCSFHLHDFDNVILTSKMEVLRA
jgi:hypothetical protein